MVVHYDCYGVFAAHLVCGVWWEAVSLPVYVLDSCVVKNALVVPTFSGWCCIDPRVGSDDPFPPLAF